MNTTHEYCHSCSCGIRVQVPLQTQVLEFRYHSKPRYSGSIHEYGGIQDAPCHEVSTSANALSERKGKHQKPRQARKRQTEVENLVCTLAFSVKTLVELLHIREKRAVWVVVPRIYSRNPLYSI